MRALHKNIIVTIPEKTTKSEAIADKFGFVIPDEQKKRDTNQFTVVKVEEISSELKGKLQQGEFLLVNTNQIEKIQVGVFGDVEEINIVPYAAVWVSFGKDGKEK